MRIALFSGLFYPYVLGGGENRYYWLAKNLVNLGHQVFVYTMRLKGVPDNESLEGININRMGIPHPHTHRALSTLPAYFIRSSLTKKSLRENRIDIIDANTYIPCFSAALLSRMLRIPFVVTFHDIYWGDWIKSLGRWWSQLLGPIIEFVVGKLPHSKIITVSNTSKKKIHRILNIPKDHITVIPNGIDLSLFRSIEKKTPSEPTIIYVGRLVPHKNVDNLLEAFKIIKKELPSARLKIIGSGENRKALEQRAIELGIKDSTSFYGYIPDYKSLIAEMSNSSIFVQPSTIEGFGMVLIEAMAARLPVVAYDLQAYRDFAKHKYNAILIEPKNVEKLAEAIIDVLRDSSLRKKLVDNGYRTACKYDWSRIAEKLLQVYAQVIEE
ncbi:MAG: glycosyltransferase family 4 protein [Candidatus Hodarchaeota archaeon]